MKTAPKAYRPTEENEHTEAIAAQIAALKYEVKHLRDPIAQKDEKEWRNTADAWLFVFDNGSTQEYYTGVGHRVAKWQQRDTISEFNRLKKANLTDHGFKIFIEVSKPVKPTLDGLLSSLAMDSTAESQSFEDWCSDYGSDTDSRKAFETYTACQKSGKFLRGLGFKDLDALREFYSQY